MKLFWTLDIFQHKLLKIKIHTYHDTRNLPLSMTSFHVSYFLPQTCNFPSYYPYWLYNLNLTLASLKIVNGYLLDIWKLKNYNQKGITKEWIVYKCVLRPYPVGTGNIAENNKTKIPALQGLCIVETNRAIPRNCNSLSIVLEYKLLSIIPPGYHDGCDIYISFSPLFT